jgi:two-component system CheB/CheR fusion protein
MLQAILNAASDAILFFDREERILAINPGCEEMFGCVGEELVGKNAEAVIPSGVRSSVGHSFRRYLQKVALRRNEGVQEAMMMRSDGRQFPAEISLVGILGDERFAVFIRDVTERRELQRSILRAATDEQRRIGQELHDGIQQELTGLALFASAVNHAIEQIGEREDRIPDAPTTPRATRENPRLAKLHTISQKLTEGLADAQKHVQALARGILASPVRADDLPEALKRLTETAGPEIAFEFVVNGSVGISDDTAASHLYRIAQEAISNAIRHGKASRIKVLLQALQDQIRLEVSDNGNGFHPSSNGDGVGLRTMEYRVQLMNGVFQVEPIPEGGTTVRCILPAGDRDRSDYQGNSDEMKSSSSPFPPADQDGAIE